MRHLHFVLATLGVLTSILAAQAQIETIVIDGLFDDWTAIDGIEDAISSDTPPVDLLEMKVTSDPDYFYVYLRLASDLDLTDVLYPHNLFLQIDVDMDASTSYAGRIWI